MGWPKFVSKFAHSASAARAARRKSLALGRRLAIETLEPRIVLSAAGLVDVGAQPAGELTGKITFIHGGHGYTTYHDDVTGVPEFWSFQRGNNNGMVEDIGNQEQMTFLADYLFRAGATVVPLRPVGHQTQEYVLDNDSPGVTFSGSWSNSVSTVYFAGTTGSAPDAIPYRYATTALTETAFARYRPTIATAGFFPVYAWTRPGTDRAVDQLYRVSHSGGITEVKINHREVGNGLIYLGTYYFEAGNGGYVDISNRSSNAGNVAIADMIRFGNGMGDINKGVGISGRTREDEPSLYWTQWHVDRSRGIAASEYDSGGQDEDSTVSASPRWAEFMNQAGPAGLPNRLFVSFHSNAANGTARGVVVLHNTGHGGTTPNQLFLAQTLGNEIEADLVAQDGQFENNWGVRNPNTYEHPDYNFGEINNAYVNNEFDATIVEVGYHDTPADAQLMRDPKFRDAVARATYQGMVKYFNNVDGGATSLTMLPGKVPQVRAEVVGSGSVKFTWTAPAANSYNGNAPTSYRIYGSTNGYGFDGGRAVAGTGTTFTLNGLDPSVPYYFKVVAENAGGEGAPSEVVAVAPAVGGKKALVVNGFDRLDRFQNPTQTYSGTIDRVRPRFSNSYDYAVQLASAIHANAADVRIDTASNEAVASGAVELGDYDAVFWIVGEESTGDDTFNATEQTKVTSFLAAGGKLFLSGGEIGWDLDAQGTGPAFYNNVLRADYVSDDANTYNVVGAGGSIFAGLSFAFDDGDLYYDTDYADRISPLGGATAAMSYSGGLGGTAAIQYTGGGSTTQLVMLAFPFETITTSANRVAVMGRVIDYFSLDEPPFTPTGDFNGDGMTDGTDFLAWQRNVANADPNLADGDGNGDNAVDGDDLALWKGEFGSLSAAAAGGSTASTSAAVEFASSEDNSPAQLEGLSAVAQRLAWGEFASPLRDVASRPRFAAILSENRHLREQAVDQAIDCTGQAGERSARVGREAEPHRESPDDVAAALDGAFAGATAGPFFELGR